ncbi:MAG: SDR family NAD(P)-dependent oxidoreductase [Bacteroidales bacterium]|nr:SDR family NAD(P)-dependent oxidoreductase [Bacteroidales bacterium]MBN2819346.1 SDR family NAD(P)-dependent oxidoreductase [Bacteroidales bacterium]
MNFNNKVFWITGASSGMGKAVSIEIAKSKCRLIISDRDAAGLTETAKIIESSGSQVRIEPLDMSDSAAIMQTAEKVLSDGEKIFGLYQFAGISQRSLVTENPLENDRLIMEVNFFGVVALTKAILPSMIENGGGQLAVASSIVGKFGFPYRSAYSASKHALHGFFETLLAENSKNNIKVSVLIGGRIRTNISKFAIDKDGNEHGKLDAGQANGISPEKAAIQICRGLRREKKEVLVGGSELIMVQIRRFLPALYYKLAKKISPL